MTEQEIHLDLGTLVMLVLSRANLSLVALTFLHPDSEPSTSSDHPAREIILNGGLGLGLACSSQILYLAFAAAWQFRWMRFYPGNPMETRGILAGLLLSAGALATAFLAICRRRSRAFS